MPIHVVSGDLFDNGYGAQAFAQGCNCQGSMGAGVAKTEALGATILGAQGTISPNI